MICVNELSHRFPRASPKRFQRRPTLQANPIFQGVRGTTTCLFPND